MSLAAGLYDALLDQDLSAVLSRHPELRSVFGKLDSEEEPSRYSAFGADVLEKALRHEVDSTERRRLCNDLIEKSLRVHRNNSLPRGNSFPPTILCF